MMTVESALAIENNQLRKLVGDLIDNTNILHKPFRYEIDQDEEMEIYRMSLKLLNDARKKMEK